MDQKFYFNDLYVRNDKGYTVLGIWDTDICTVIPVQHKMIYEYIVENIDNIDQLKQELENVDDEKRKLVYSIYEDVKSLEDKYVQNDKVFSEIGLTSTVNKSVKIKYTNIIIDKLNKKINFEKVLIWGNAILLLLAFFSYTLFHKRIDLNKLWSLNLYVGTFIFVYFFMICHEIGHLIIICSKNLKPYSVNFALEYGIIPVFYVKTYNMYSINRRDYIFAMSSGLLVNLFFLLMNINLFIFTDSAIFACMAVSNYRIIIDNISPLTLSDSYYICSALFCKPNLRKKMFLFLNGEKIKFSPLYVMYIVGTLINILLSVSVDAIWLSNIIASKVSINVRILEIGLVLSALGLNISLIRYKYKKYTRNNVV